MALQLNALTARQRGFMEGVERTVEWLRSLHPGLLPEVEDAEQYSVLRLPYPQGAEFQFHLFLYDDAFELRAHPIEEPEIAIFWHQSFERLGASSLEPVEEAFRSFVLEAISDESRVRYRRGLLFHRFTLETHQQSGWNRLGGQVLAFRGGYAGPRPPAARRDYVSPPLAPVA